jgi:metal-dependent amidase/aminoacylase/carboxypeptidase family protein
VLMIGTIRTLNPDTRTLVHERVRRLAENVAIANGAEAEVSIRLGYPVTMNDPALTTRMIPSLQRIVDQGLMVMPPATGSEDFSYFAEEVPGLFIGLGVGSDDPALVHPNHSPLFYADERALPIGVRAMASLAVDFLNGNSISQD